MDRLRREESGFTLVELVVAMGVGTVILLASFMMLDSSVTLTGRVTDRVDRTQRARLAMEQITRELRSQVCPAAGVPALIDGQTYSVKFYIFTGVGTGSAGFVPSMREIAWDTNTNSIVERTWAGTGASPYTTYAATPTTRTLLTNVRPPPSNAPIFSYWSSGASSAFSPPLTGPNLTATSDIKIKFVTYASNNTTGTGQSITLDSETFSRTTDPNVASAVPECA
jgi:prepilin-type N-terminal cleavage/methylation domain-containing protein